jgi:hypothetical protein
MRRPARGDVRSGERLAVPDAAAVSPRPVQGGSCLPTGPLASQLRRGARSRGSPGGTGRRTTSRASTPEAPGRVARGNTRSRPTGLHLPRPARGGSTAPPAPPASSRRRTPPFPPARSPQERRPPARRAPRAGATPAAAAAAARATVTRPSWHGWSRRAGATGSRRASVAHARDVLRGPRMVRAMSRSKLLVAAMVASSLLVLCGGSGDTCTPAGGVCTSGPGPYTGCIEDSYQCPTDPTFGNAYCVMSPAARCGHAVADLNGCGAGQCRVGQAGTSTDDSTSSLAPSCGQFSCCAPCAD